jgi:hypothetical protein
MSHKVALIYSLITTACIIAGAVHCIVPVIRLALIVFFFFQEVQPFCMSVEKFYFIFSSESFVIHQNCTVVAQTKLPFSQYHEQGTQLGPVIQEW